MRIHRNINAANAHVDLDDLESALQIVEATVPSACAPKAESDVETEDCALVLYTLAGVQALRRRHAECEKVLDLLVQVLDRHCEQARRGAKLRAEALRLQVLADLRKDWMFDGVQLPEGV